MRFSVTTVLAVVGALLLGRCSADLPPPPVITQTFVDTVAPAALLAALEDGALENSGLRAKLAGHVRVEPVYILHTDTLVTPPDTVVQVIALDGKDNLTLAPLIHHDSLWAPEIHHYDVSRCDDGWSWKAGELVCDRARFGHLSAVLSASALYPLGSTASGGIEWSPSYRSGWRGSVATDPTGRASLTVTRSLRLF